MALFKKCYSIYCQCFYDTEYFLLPNQKSKNCYYIFMKINVLLIYKQTHDYEYDISYYFICFIINSTDHNSKIKLFWKKLNFLIW